MACRRRCCSICSNASSRGTSPPINWVCWRHGWTGNRKFRRPLVQALSRHDGLRRRRTGENLPDARPGTHWGRTHLSLSKGLRWAAGLGISTGDHIGQLSHSTVIIRAQMRYTDIKRHLQPFNISKRRKTTINHAFASAVAPCDRYDEVKVREAIALLGQNPEADLRCAYCDNPAETWDHVFATVKASVFSGAGHRLGNLLPCCKPCNSSKGSKPWVDFLRTLHPESRKLTERITQIQGYLDKLHVADSPPVDLPEYRELLKIRDEILSLMNRADVLAETIRTSPSPIRRPSP